MAWKTSMLMLLGALLWPAASLASILPARSAATRQPSRRCTGAVVARSAAVKVSGLRLKPKRPGDQPAANYYACLRPRGRRVLLGQAGGGDEQYGAQSLLSRPLIAGTFAAAIETDGLNAVVSCFKYLSNADPAPPGCVARDVLHVADARSHRAATLAIASEITGMVANGVAATRLAAPGAVKTRLAAVSTAGSAAWFSSPTALFAARFGGPVQSISLQAPIAPATVAFTAQGLLSWRDTSGAPHTAVVS